MSVDRAGGAWDYECPACEFVSTGWATKKLAAERGEQHEAEHETGEPMQEMVDFMTDRGAA